MNDIQIIYTKEGMRIIHPTGANQFLTLEDLYSLWNRSKEKEKKVEQDTEVIHKYITEVKKLQ